MHGTVWLRVRARGLRRCVISLQKGWDSGCCRCGGGAVSQSGDNADYYAHRPLGEDAPLLPVLVICQLPTAASDFIAVFKGRFAMRNGLLCAGLALLYRCSRARPPTTPRRGMMCILCAIRGNTCLCAFSTAGGGGVRKASATPSSYNNSQDGSGFMYSDVANTIEQGCRLCGWKLVE